jgi:hypothetical protein
MTSLLITPHFRHEALLAYCPPPLLQAIPALLIAGKAYVS